MQLILLKGWRVRQRHRKAAWQVATAHVAAAAGAHNARLGKTRPRFALAFS